MAHIKYLEAKGKVSRQSQNGHQIHAGLITRIGLLVQRIVAYQSLFHSYIDKL